MKRTQVYSITGPFFPQKIIEHIPMSWTVRWESSLRETWRLIRTMWGPSSIAKLVDITPITMVYGTYNELVTKANLNQQTSLGPHIVVKPNQLRWGLGIYGTSHPAWPWCEDLGFDPRGIGSSASQLWDRWCRHIIGISKKIYVFRKTDLQLGGTKL